MREIKFRAWNKKLKQMNQVKSLSFVAHQDGRLDFIDAGWKWMPEVFELMQFTCLYDKNGKEIYEGDIVRWHKILHTSRGKEIDWGEAIGIIEHNVSAWSSEIEIKHIKGKPSSHFYDEMGARFMFDEIEVIGNIYENPELLEGEKK